VAGFNDVVMSAHSDPPLTTIHVPARDLGLAAWHLLVSDRPRTAKSVGEYLPFKLVERSSTARPSDGPSVDHAAVGEGDGASRRSGAVADLADTEHEDSR
jgi:hypothetical protein